MATLRQKAVNAILATTQLRHNSWHNISLEAILKPKRDAGIADIASDLVFIVKFMFGTLFSLGGGKMQAEEIDDLVPHMN